MASIFGHNFNVEYTIGGDIREVEIDGECIYRTEAEAKRTKPPGNVAVEQPGWKEMFAERYVALGLHKPGFGGLHRSPTYWLVDNGLLPPETVSEEQNP